MPKGLNQESVAGYRKKVKQYGSWAGVRWLRNQGIEFEAAYFIMFDKMPRR